MHFLGITLKKKTNAMKTKNNVQENFKELVKMMVLRGYAFISILVLFSLIVTAQDFGEQVLANTNYGKLAMRMVVEISEISKTNITAYSKNVEVSAQSNHESLEPEADEEPALQIEVWKYDAQEFVEAEMALEIESWTNINAKTSSEVVKAESALQINAWMNSIEYNAKRFVDTEMTLECESWMTKENSSKSAEPFTSVDCEVEIDKYAQK
jgi:hypothetical protein